MAPAKKTLKKATGSQTEKVNPAADEELEEEQQENTDPPADPSADDLEGSEEDDDVEEKPDDDPVVGAPRDGQTFKTGDPVILKGVQRGGLLHVTEPVYRAAKAPGSSRWRFHLLHARGAQISMSKVKEIGERDDKKDPGTFQVSQEEN